ncbi:hypothetical protein DZC78_13555 [Olleya aquimaris]|uniref:Thrombospondin type 3 repeat-containing protein n=1 Tax=Olleya sediminilitoris TaxID=2795739 RepID=A0ABS1WJJ5_9FLAO|nr:hypothetical protein [Olleya sediminilitoris]AXO81371.1 hypothetical protein DZC78_13555 [Olleya aquimaris]MBL7559300.1 hypothetical protein [Olleya sediminilitoris]
MKTKQVNYSAQRILLLTLVICLFNCSVNNIEDELNEEDLSEESLRFTAINPCDCTESGGTGDGGTDNEADEDGNSNGDNDGDGDPDKSDPDPNDPCKSSTGSIPDPENPIWYNADCDFDGIPNGIDPDPYRDDNSEPFN